ncbi:hypothetical protein B0H10DRAFT_2036349, partial [Mycena sp. CBHHK59/15]
HLLIRKVLIGHFSAAWGFQSRHVTRPCPPGALSATASSPTAGTARLPTTYLQFQNYWSLVPMLHDWWTYMWVRSFVSITILRVWTKYRVGWYLMPSQCIV